MASALIHIAIAKKVNEKLKRDESKLYIGSIAPDIAKLIGRTKDLSHFITDEENIPNLNLFLNKYQNYLFDDFVMGYYLHLLGDYFWFKYFITEIVNSEKDIITTLNNETLSLSEEDIIKYIYNDYTNLNIKIIENYGLDLKIFYNEIPKLDNIITEIPMEKIDTVVNKMGTIIENSKQNKNYLFNIDNINQFIETTSTFIINNLKELNQL